MHNTHQPECCGTLFPDVLNLPDDRPASGKGFTVVLECAGGSGELHAPSQRIWSNGTSASSAPNSRAATSSRWRNELWSRPFRIGDFTSTKKEPCP